MLRLLLLVVIAVGIYLLWLHIQRIKKQANQSSVDDIEPMIKCHFCGAYTPQKSAIKGTNNQWYCCSEHARQAEK